MGQDFILVEQKGIPTKNSFKEEAMKKYLNQKGFVEVAVAVLGCMTVVFAAFVACVEHFK